MSMTRLFVLAMVGLLTMGAMAEADQTDKRLDDLFQRLQSTSSETEAHAIENAIWEIWTASDDEQVSRYMRAGERQMHDGDMRAAFITYQRVVEMAPKFAEGWNKRATVEYMMHDYDASARDIAETLKLEPRHFGALSGLGLVQIALNRPRAAITAFEMALAVHPHIAGARENIKMLKKDLEGDERPI
jgi:tetratricopeptide (TPR) repeat protein